MYKKMHLHFVGINGIGMSGIAKILHKQGHTISGCDLACDGANILELITAGCKISSGHNSETCKDLGIDLVVYSSDVPYDSQELVAARNNGIKTVQRATVLAEIMRSKFSIGVAGSHGKTTTTSMIGHILLQAQLDPTIIVGGIMHNIGNNAYCGQGKYLVAETDESDRSLLLLPVSIAVLTNIDFEHANTYKNIDEVTEVFHQYLNRVPFFGKAIISDDDPQISTIKPQLSCATISYGLSPSADIQAINIQLQADESFFDIINNKTKQILGSITIAMPSIYNVLNATAAITTALELEIPFTLIANALQSYQGVDRRFSYKGLVKNIGAQIFDDYGHHPTEIGHSLITAQRKTKKDLIVVFQPQRYTRTYHLWDEFVHVFSQANSIKHLIITDIHSSNEQPINNVSGKQLAQEIQNKAAHINVHYLSFEKDLKNLEEKIILIARQDDLILLLGAGKINKLADILI